jgi:hypothetical protein
MGAPRERQVELCGELLGIRRAGAPGGHRAEVVRVTNEQRPNGPAENALVVVEVVDSRRKRARYISWIGYYDIEEAQTVEPRAWELIEPAREYRSAVGWVPFGWPDMQVLSNH